MKAAAVLLLASVSLLLTGAGDEGAEPSTVRLRRADKAILVPSGEKGEVSVYVTVTPTSRESKRYRYTYRVYYREDFPAEAPFAPRMAEGEVPLMGFDVIGHPDCDYAAVAGPGRRENGPWRVLHPSGGTLAYETPSRRWLASDRPLVFTFTSACAPAVGLVEVRMTPEEDASGAHALSGSINVPMRPPSLTGTAGGQAPPRPRNYARPSRRRRR